jgi:3',5'-cyclic AMP phosphodiesterase CpdA
MDQDWKRRNFLALMGVGGVVFASGLVGCGASSSTAAPTVGAPGALRTGRRNEDFFFLQLSDTHFGFKGPPNPQADVTLERAVATINAVDTQPDFIVFTGDLIQTTDDVTERRTRMARFKEIVSALKVKDIRFLPGEHDASLDRGDAFREAFGETRYSFDHKGVHCIALDNVSEASGVLGEAQLQWLANDLTRVPADTQVLVFAHRPLFDLYPAWDWDTKDGARAIALLNARSNVTVFYGHIHQEHHHTTGKIAHHSARSLVFPLPAPGSTPKKSPLPWDPASVDHGLGWRAIALNAGKPRLTEVPFK